MSQTQPDTPTSKLRVILGDAGLEALSGTSVAVFGVGGVGSNCVEALARGGVGCLAIVDRDVVSPSNINRQAIAFHSTVGMRKVDVMEAMVHDINPGCEVVKRDDFVLAENVGEIYDALLAACGGHIDYVVDAIDTVSTKLALALLAQERGIRLISSMGGAMKLHPECLRVDDIHNTVNCRLSRVMRKECRRRGIKRLRVLYSCEQVAAATAPEGTERSERAGMGTASWMPPIMGQIIAGEVIRAISGVGREPVRADGAVRRG